MEVWGPWVAEAVLFLDGDGAVRHWKYPGAYSAQPAFDQAVYAVVRQKWIALENERREDATR